MSKKEYIEVLNNMIRDIPVPLEKLINIISDYLTEINAKNSNEMILLITQNPPLVYQALPKAIDYLVRKYCIFSITFNNKIIYYYGTD